MSWKNDFRSVISALLPRRPFFVTFGDVNFQVSRALLQVGLIYVSSGRPGHKFDFTLMPQCVHHGITLSERWIRATLFFSAHFRFSIAFCPLGRLLCDNGARMTADCF